MKKLLSHITLLALCCSCSEVIEPTSYTVNITAEQSQSSFLFAGLPVQFNLKNVPSTTENDWSFGDLNTGSGTSPSHTFDFPGSYNVTVLVGNLKARGDSTVNIAPPLNLIGSKSTSENGKFLFERPGGGYTVIHTLNDHSSASDWMVLSTSSTFDSITSRMLPLGWYNELRKATLNNEGNIIAITKESKMIEMTRNGVIMKEVFPSSGWFPSDLQVTANEYIISGFKYDATLMVTRFNHDFETLSEVSLNVQREGYSISNCYIDPSGIIRIQYYQKTFMENPPRVFVKMDMTGTVLLEKNYTSLVDGGASFALSSGYMLYGNTSENYSSELVFTKIDNNGNVLWTIKTIQQAQYAQTIYDGGVSFIDDGTSVIIFCDNQKAIKVNSSGEIVWSRRFGLSTDTFNAAIRNSKGNIVLLGSHQFDYINNQMTNEYAKRDLVLLEIDSDGNLK